MPPANRKKSDVLTLKPFFAASFSYNCRPKRYGGSVSESNLALKV